MSEHRYHIRVMSRDEIPLAIDWAGNEGWNPGLYDLEAFHAADPEGFLVGELDGKPIAVISAIKYGASFGFVGFYIVKSEYRGLGHGLAIWDAALARLAGRCVGLDGVVAQQDNYRKSGFELAYRNIRYQGSGGGDVAVSADLVPLSIFDFDTVRDYDAAFFPDRRDDFLKAWLNQPEAVALGLREQGRLAGYGMIRPCREGYKIGPLFADTAEGAEALFSRLKALVPETDPVFLDIPETNPAALELVRRHAMAAMFETARMYRNGNPTLPLARLFGVTSFELG